MKFTELVIKEFIKKAFNYAIIDYSERVDKNNSLLYQIFHEDENGNQNKFDNLNMFENALALISNKDNSEKSRRLQVNVGFNTERASMPTVHVLLSSDETEEQNNGIGFDENYEEAFYFTENGKDFARKNYSVSFGSMYNILITSDNIFEVMILYTFLKAVFLGAHDFLDTIFGVRNVKVSGNDVNLQDNLSPNIYVRNLSLKGFYEEKIPQFNIDQLIKTSTFNGRIL